MIILYDSRTTNFNNNGIGILADAITCEITEELNGVYELELKYPIDEKGRWKYLIEGNIIKADGQLFRIYRKNKSMSSIYVNARHIFYDLLDNFIEDARPENCDAATALNKILSSTQFTHRFTSMSNVSGTNTSYIISRNPVEAIFLDDGLIGRWGGELVRDNFLIKLLENRGMDRGFTIRYGKNLIGIEEDLDLDSVITRIMPQGYDGSFLPEKYVDSPLLNNYPSPKIRKIEFSDIKIDEENGVTEEIAIQKIRDATICLFTDKKVDIPKANYKVCFLELTKTEEYKNYSVLETVYLGDIVTIKHETLLFDLKAKVIKYKKDALTGRYIEIELGNFKNTIDKSFNSAINQIAETVELNRGGLQATIDKVTNLLTNALGGYVVKRNGEILIMDTEDINTATKVWRWNLNGLGYSKTGINGPYETAMTMDGHIAGSFISAYSIDVNQVKANFGQNLDLSSNTSIKLAVSEKIEEIKPYTVEIFSTNGLVFKNGVINTKLIAKVYKGREDITDSIDANKFRWTRVSNDSVGDNTWNTSHFGGTKEITITSDDVNVRATFNCEILE